MASFQKTAVLVSCSKTKLSFASPAKALYCSTLFKAQRAFAEARSTEWFILSAKHGLIHPDTLIKPYDQTLSKMALDDQKAWASSVAHAIQETIQPRGVLIITASHIYTRYLIPLIDNRYDVEMPLAGVSLFYQVRKLREMGRGLE